MEINDFVFDFLALQISLYISFNALVTFHHLPELVVLFFNGLQKNEYVDRVEGNNVPVAFASIPFQR